MNRVMVVDSNHEVGEKIFSAISKIDDYEIAAIYNNASEALISLNLIKPNMIFINVLLNGMTGIKLTNLIKQKYPAVQIILMSDDSSYALEGLEAGADSFISKPIRSEDIIKILTQVENKNINH